GSYTYDPSGAFGYLASGQSATDNFTYTATDALGTPSNPDTVTVTIWPAVVMAVDNTNATYDTVAVYGNVLTNDTDPWSGLAVGTVNGSAANVGNTIQLSSGALLTLNADGSYSYDPNGAFSYVETTGSATDTFTYTATDSLGGQSNTATVTIYIYA